MTPAPRHASDHGGPARAAVRTSHLHLTLRDLPPQLSGEQSGGLPGQMHFRELSRNPSPAATGAH